MGSIKEKQDELDNQVLTVEQYKEMERQAAKRRTTNETHIYGFVSKKILGEARPRVDKATKLPICDSDGNELFYKPSMSIQFDFTGGSLLLQVEDEALFNSVDEFESYYMTARHGSVRVFGKPEIALVPLKFEF